jgi:hypothetical protein
MELLALPDDVRTAVLVEGASDREAVQEAARLAGRDLAAEGIAVMAMGGATNIASHVERLGPAGRRMRLAGLYDAAEARYFERALAAAGLLGDGASLTEAGFFRCDVDLEDELIRALGVDEMERFIADQGEADSFRSFRNQPAQRDRLLSAQLHRFIGTKGGRKIRYAPALVRAIDPGHLPEPLRLLLRHI